MIGREKSMYLNIKIIMKIITLSITILFLWGLPKIGSLLSNRPTIEFTLIIGVLITLCVFYLHATGLSLSNREDDEVEIRNDFYRSLSFWTAFIYTCVACYHTYQLYYRFV